MSTETTGAQAPTLEQRAKAMRVQLEADHGLMASHHRKAVQQALLAALRSPEAQGEHTTAPVIAAAWDWWHGNRPNGWSDEQHRANPAVNCTTSRERMLALAVAAMGSPETQEPDGSSVREMPDVRKGQVWADNDPRSNGRTFRVLERLPNGARCVVLTDREGIVSPRVGREFVALLKRFRPTSTGYRLVQDAPPVDSGDITMGGAHG